MDTDTDDITSNGFGNTLTRDGQGSATANLPMNGFRHTGVGAGVATTDYATMAQIQGQTVNWGVATGTADAIALSVSPAVTALADGMLFGARLSAANATTTPTLAVSGLTPHTITKAGGTALAVGDLPANLAEALFRYNLANTRYELLNPASGVVGPGSSADGDFVLFSGTSGKILKDGGSTIAPVQLATASVPFGAVMLNGTLVQSQSANAQTFAIKTLAGTDPSATDVVYFIFRNATLATGNYVVRSVTAALSITIPSGQAIGFSNATPGRVWIGALDNAGTVELFVINCLTGTNITPLQNYVLAGTSAVSGASSSGVAYSTTARSSKAFVVIGFATWEAGGTLGTAGTWNVAPTRLQMFQPGSTPLPGQEIQRQRNATGAVTSGSTVMPVDDTIPQGTEGDQFLSQAITPTSSANLLDIESLLNLASNGTGNAAVALFQDATANALAANFAAPPASGIIYQARLSWSLLSGTLSSTTFKIRMGGASDVHTFNGLAAARLYGGALASVMVVREIMA